MALKSAIYEGWVRHRRHAPAPHAFRYRMFQLYLDLAELDQVFAGRWFWSVDRRNLAQFRATLIEELSEQPIAFAMDDDDDDDEDDDGEDDAPR